MQESGDNNTPELTTKEVADLLHIKHNTLLKTLSLYDGLKPKKMFAKKYFLWTPEDISRLDAHRKTFGGGGNRRKTSAQQQS